MFMCWIFLKDIKDERMLRPSHKFKDYSALDERMDFMPHHNKSYQLKNNKRYTISALRNKNY